MSRPVRGAIAAAVLCTLLTTTSLRAEPLQVTVPIGQGGTITAPGTMAAMEQIKKIPGGAGVVPAKKFQESYALSMKDMLKTTPGVMAQPRWGEESRLSIRGSGLSRSFHLRGITLLQDGVPFTFADGSGDFQEIDPLILQHVEVYRGGQGLRYGAATLGGAINMVTPTAYTLPYQSLLRAEGGSFKTGRLHAETSEKFENADIFVATTKSNSEGYRKQSEQNNLRFSGNVGVRLDHDAETRFYAAWNDIHQEVPGTISKNDALHNPTTVPAINISGDYERNIRSLRLANRTAFRMENGLGVEMGAYVNDKTLYHPIFQVIDQESVDLGAFTRVNGEVGANEFTGGLNLGRGVNNAKRYLNVSGNRGALQADGKQTAKNVEIYGENRWRFMPNWNFITGLQGTFAIRDYEDHLNSTNDADKNYKSLNPKIGLMWNVAPKTEIYTSLTRSSEAPTFSELVQGAVPGFVPIDLQKAWTTEIGTRGAYDAFTWDATIYHARVHDELLNYTVTADVPASTFNANKTIHQGLELGAGWRLNDAVSFQGIYNLNDFKFDGDKQFGSNDLAGAPRQQIRLSARYEDHGFFVEPNVEWVPEAPWVDYANTLKADDYALVGVNAGWGVNKTLSFFVDARNLTDEKYITSFTTITDARTAGTNIFYTGDGRSVFGGIKMKF